MSKPKRIIMIETRISDTEKMRVIETISCIQSRIPTSWFTMHPKNVENYAFSMESHRIMYIPYVDGTLAPHLGASFYAEYDADTDRWSVSNSAETISGVFVSRAEMTKWVKSQMKRLTRAN